MKKTYTDQLIDRALKTDEQLSRVVPKYRDAVKRLLRLAQGVADTYDTSHDPDERHRLLDAKILLDDWLLQIRIFYLQRMTE